MDICRMQGWRSQGDKGLPIEDSSSREDAGLLHEYLKSKEETGLGQNSHSMMSKKVKGLPTHEDAVLPGAPGAEAGPDPLVETVVGGEGTCGAQ